MFWRKNACRYSPGVAPNAWRKRLVKWLALEAASQRNLPRGCEVVRSNSRARFRRHASRYWWGGKPTLAEHPREVVAPTARAQSRQLTEADGLVRWLLMHHQMALMRGQSLPQGAGPGVDLAEQGMAEQFVGQAAGQRAFARLVQFN